MSSSELVRPQQLSRKAVVYIRQSTAHQVLSNLESGKMQRAMREHAQRLGWPAERIEVVEGDTGVSATSTAGRDAYKNLLGEIALGHVGIVLSYESARLSRNCSDWYPLLDVCAVKGCLIGDRDGVYESWTANGRLLLGMKGIISEIEMHTIRGRLLAGLQNKARRGELALLLPAGLERRADGVVVKAPDVQVQQAIELVFRTFQEVRSANQVVRHFQQHGLRLPRRHGGEGTVWTPPTPWGILGILNNPAYAGAFTYGKTKVLPQRKSGCGRPRQQRRPMNEWSVIVKDRYPAYVSWETFEKIQAALRDNHAEYEEKQSRGVPRTGAVLLHGLLYCGQCGHKLVVHYRRGLQYDCDALWRKRQAPVCQRVPAAPLDRAVADAFLAALAPAELDLYEQALAARRAQRAQVDTAKQRELERLRYEVQLARRQYDRVDPDNRLVAGELERRWETALQALRVAEESVERERAERDKVVPLHVPRELRAAFSSLGESLPGLWPQETLRPAQKKALVRCLVDKVVVHRRTPDCVAVRIVWRGGAVSDVEVPVPVASRHALSNYDQLEAQALALEAQGFSDAEIAAQLTAQGFRSPLRDTVLPSTVTKIRGRHERRHRYRVPRNRRMADYLTVADVAQRLEVTPHWIHYRIGRGVIQIEPDEATGLYLFPDRPETLAELRRLKAGTVANLSYPRGHQDE